MRSFSGLAEHLLAAAVISVTTAKPFNPLEARKYTNGTKNDTAITPKVFLIDMVSPLVSAVDIEA